VAAIAVPVPGAIIKSPTTSRHSGRMPESSTMDGSPRLLWRWLVNAPVQQPWCRRPASPPWDWVPASCRDDGLR